MKKLFVAVALVAAAGVVDVASAQAPDLDDPFGLSRIEPERPLPELEYSPPTEEEARERLARLPALEPVEEHEQAWVRLPLLWDQMTDREARFHYLYLSRMRGAQLDLLLTDVQEMRRVAAIASREIHPEDASYVYDSVISMRENERSFWMSYLPKVPSAVPISEASGAEPAFGGGGPEVGNSKEGPIRWIEIDLGWDEFRGICRKEPLTGWEGSHGWSRGSWLNDHGGHLNDLLGDPSFRSLPEEWQERLNLCQEEMHFAGAEIQRRWEICMATGGFSPNRRSAECNAAGADAQAATNRLHRCLDPRDGRD